MNTSGYIHVADPNAPGPAPFNPLPYSAANAIVAAPAEQPLVSVRLEGTGGYCSSVPYAEDSYNAAIAPYVTRDTYSELMGRVLQASRATFFELGLTVFGFLLIIGGFALFISNFGSGFSDDLIPKVIGSFAMFIAGAIISGVVRWLAKGWREDRVRGAVSDASNACAQRRLPLYWRVTKEPVGRWVRGSTVVGTIYAFTVEVLPIVAVAQPRMQVADWAYAQGPGVQAAMPYSNPNV